MARLRKIDDENFKRGKWTDALSEFLELKRVEGLSEQTRSDYNRTTRLFFKRFPDAWESDDKLKDAAYAHLSEDIMPATFNNRLIYLRTFFKWCVETGKIDANPLANIKKRKAESRIVAIEAEVLRELLDAPDQSTFVGLRDYGLILLTLDSGIRPKEALSLLPCDFNAAAREIYVPAKVAKTRVSRTLPISSETVRAIKKLLSVRPLEWGENVPIFCTWEGKQLNRHTWGDRMELYSNMIGRKIRPYDLRHVFALEFIRNGANAFAVQKALGHTTMEVTKGYIALADNDLKATHEKASPLNTLLAEKTKRKTKVDNSRRERK
ncbi:tyrosine-type recombinase/integrase [Paenibacillus macerans]|uniref:tyrosine-type recombinase/integrase n=1 Tax=Paenibacillus macerans TaxID=44252 RepID=UPI003D3221FD